MIEIDTKVHVLLGSENAQTLHEFPDEQSWDTCILTTFEHLDGTVKSKIHTAFGEVVTVEGKCAKMLPLEDSPIADRTYCGIVASGEMPKACRLDFKYFTCVVPDASHETFTGLLTIERE